jgi:hypothetical protein
LAVPRSIAMFCDPNLKNLEKELIDNSVSYRGGRNRPAGGRRTLAGRWRCLNAK